MGGSINQEYRLSVDSHRTGSFTLFPAFEIQHVRSHPRLFFRDLNRCMSAERNQATGTPDDLHAEVLSVPTTSTSSVLAGVS